MMQANKGLIKSSDDIKRIAESGAILRSMFEVLATLQLEGLTTWKLDSVIENFITSRGGRPSFKTLPGYRFASCISINDHVVHGVPSKRRVIASGDIISIDVGVVKNGYFSDACRTYIVGSVKEEYHYLVQKSRMALNSAIALLGDGLPLSEIGTAISQYAEAASLVVLEEFTGHGVGYALHEEPVIFHGRRNISNFTLREGMVIAIEPVLSLKKSGYVILYY